MQRLLNQSEKYLKTDVRYLLHGGIWLSGAKVIGLLATLFTSIIFANWLPEETYGTYRYILSILAILALFTLPGINTAVTTEVARSNDRAFLTGLTAKIRWSILAAILTICVGIYYYIAGNILFAATFFLSAIGMPLVQITYLYTAVCSGKKQFAQLSSHTSASNVFVAIAMIATAWITDNLVLIFIAYFSAYILSQSISSYYIWRNTKNIATDDDTDIVSYGKHLSVMNGLAVVANNFDKILLFQFAGPAVLAGYYLALMPFKQIKSFLSIINTMLLPKLSDRTFNEVKKNLPKKILTSYLFVIPPVILYIFSAPYIFSIIFPLYVDFVLISQLVSGLLLLVPITILATALTAAKKQRALYYVSVSTAAIRVIMLSLLVPLFGITGAVITIFVSQIFNAGFTVVLFLRQN